MGMKKEVTWKNFLFPSKAILIFLVVIILITSFFTAIFLWGEEGSSCRIPDYGVANLRNAIVPFEFVEINCVDVIIPFPEREINLNFINLILNIIIWYLIIAAIVFIYKRYEKD